MHRAIGRHSIGAAVIEEAEELLARMSVFDAPRQFDPDIIGSDDDVPPSHPSVGRQPFGDRFPQRVREQQCDGRYQEPTRDDVAREQMRELQRRREKYQDSHYAAPLEQNTRHDFAGSLSVWAVPEIQGTEYLGGDQERHHSQSAELQ